MNSTIALLPFSRAAVAEWRYTDEKHADWPVVYILEDGGDPEHNQQAMLRDVYVGESLNVARRLVQHLDTPTKQHLKTIRVIIDATYNKSVCLDLEAYLIKMLAGDGANRVLNRNEGITESNYYRREVYREGFRNIFDHLRSEGIFTRDATSIENSDLFKLSPFKTLTNDQATSIELILRGFFADLEHGNGGSVVIQGDPGTGKTVVAIYLIKLLMDIKLSVSFEDTDPECRFADFFTQRHRDQLQRFRVGMVVPQQSLRESIKKVFKKTPGLHSSMVIHPFGVGQSIDSYDLLVVDETHRLNQRASQASAILNDKFSTITKTLFGEDDYTKTQLDWIRAKSRHQIFLLDVAQSVRPADLPPETLSGLVHEASGLNRHFSLRSQMRVRAGSSYISYIRQILDPRPLAMRPQAQEFGQYDFRIFENVGEMREQIFRRDQEVGLSRIVAGCAWDWLSKRNPTAYDITIGSTSLRWNSTSMDWIASPNAINEVGSIHTVQGYDLNYVGVIIGPELGFDLRRGRLQVYRNSYCDKKGKENNPLLGIVYSDADLLRFITQIYAVLFTRGILGTYLYVSDRGLREYLRGFIPSA